MKLDFEKEYFSPFLRYCKILSRSLYSMPLREVNIYIFIRIFSRQKLLIFKLLDDVFAKNPEKKNQNIKSKRSLILPFKDERRGRVDKTLVY